MFVPKFPFTLTFFDDGTPQPKFLGTSRSRSEVDNLRDSIPPTPAGHGESPANAAPDVKQHFEDFRDRCAIALEANKKKGAVAKKKKEEDRLLTIRDWYLQLRRAQRYLGLRPKTGKIQPPDGNLSWDDQEKFRGDQMKQTHHVLDPLNVNHPAPFAFEKETVIIAVDIESYERAHNLITEIGVSTLDTLDLVDVPPGPGGKAWYPQIRSRHFRIKGREHLVNKDFCIGYPDAFQFGKSEFVDLAEAAAKVDGCFEWPFSVQSKHKSLDNNWMTDPAFSATQTSTGQETSDDWGGVRIGAGNVEQDKANKAAVSSVLNGIGDEAAVNRAVDLAETKQPDPETLQRGPKDRNILLVGHDVRSDLEYLRNLGSKIFAPSRSTYPIAAMDIMATGEVPAKILASFVEALDTAPLYRVLKKETQNRSLGSIVTDLGLPCYFPHNGGNDARYTLEALVAMLVKARLEDDENPKEDDETVKKPVESGWNESWDQASSPNVDFKARARSDTAPVQSASKATGTRDILESDWNDPWNQGSHWKGDNSKDIGEKQGR